MRHSQLKAFHHVALLGGFSRAAEALFLTQPAISEQVRKLEQEHDVLLFERTRRQVTLTPQGQGLFRLTRQLFETEAQIGEYMSQTRAAVDGTLRIIADSAHHVTAILTRFRQKYPNVVVTLRTSNSQQVLDELRAYNADLGVVGNLSTGRDMATLALGETSIIAFAARGFVPAGTTQMGLAELADLPLVFREKGSKTRQKLQEAAAARAITLTPAIEAEGRETLREVVASGAGIGFVSEAEFGHDARLVPIRLRDVDARMSETLVHMRQRRDVKVIRAFVDVARTSLGIGK